MTEFKVTLDLSERLEAAINRLCGVVETNLGVFYTRSGIHA